MGWALIAALAGAPAAGLAQTTPTVRTWTYAYTPQGQLDWTDGPLAGAADTVDYDYTAAGDLSKVTNELGHAVEVTQFDLRGRPLAMVDANGTTTALSYDPMGRVKTVTHDAASATASSTYAFEYSPVGDLTRMTLPLGGWLAYVYDDARRLIEVRNDRGEVALYGRNANSDLTSVQIKPSDAGAVARQQTLVYDELGRLRQSIGAASQTTAYGYDRLDNPTSRTDARGRVWSTAFDALDRVAAEIDPEGHAVQTSYDGQDTPISFQDGRALRTTWAADGFGQVRTETSPDRRITRYAYDVAGRLIGKFEPGTVEVETVETRYAYDAAGRLTSQTYPKATAENISFIYDSASVRAVGRLARVNDPSGSTSFSYDAQGRVVRATQWIGGHVYTTSYRYDRNGELTSLTLPSGRLIQYGRASDGRVTSVTTRESASATNAPLVSGVFYRPMDEGLAGLAYANGLGLRLSYDADGRVFRTRLASASGATLDMTFGFDADGRLTRVTDFLGGVRTAAFTYTDDGRLKTASGPWGQRAYAYDAAGNRVQEDATTAGVSTSRIAVLPANTNRLAEQKDPAGTVHRALFYSQRGAVTLDQRTGLGAYEYLYNYAGRLVQVKQDGVLVGQYGYDWTGRRVTRDTLGAGPTSRDYVYDLSGRLLAEYDGASGAVLKEYAWLDDLPLAQFDRSAGGAPVTHYIHAGRLNEPLLMTNAARAKVWEQWMEPFGAAGVIGTNTAALDLRLPGQSVQLETGALHQNWHRDYDPSTGRYIQPDPLGLEAGQNLYAYVDGDPLNAVDPEGLSRVRAAREVIKAAQKAAKRLKAGKPPAYGLPPPGVRPPVKNPQLCKPGPASRPGVRAKGGQSLYDERGGEWRYKPEDKYHNPHWDYNPHDSKYSQWQNIPIGPKPPVK